MKSPTNTSLAKRIVRRLSSHAVVAIRLRFLTGGFRASSPFVGAVMLALVLSGAVPARSKEKAETHRITVKFNYDFDAMHACPVKNAAPCVQQFDVYNVTDTGKRILLFTIPAPKGAKNLMRGIRGTSKPLVFAPGEHMIEVTAVANDGKESKQGAWTTMVNIKP
ncbi:MAG TPA: hypothetical protein VNK23_03030 [Candidatus Dormibacteraeota bacterium]|nr:hypothetical protein [Candidatus Dormibacteraeota bacterium]